MANILNKSKRSRQKPAYKIVNQIQFDLLNNPVKLQKSKHKKWIRLKKSIEKAIKNKDQYYKPYPQLINSKNKEKSNSKKQDFARNKHLYKQKLLAKQQLKIFFGNIKNKQVKTLYKKAKEKCDPIIPTNYLFITLLERRLITVLFRSNFVKNIKEAKKLILHSCILVNGKVVTYPNFILKENDFISLNLTKPALRDKIFLNILSNIIPNNPNLNNFKQKNIATTITNKFQVDFTKYAKLRYIFLQRLLSSRLVFQTSKDIKALSYGQQRLRKGVDKNSLLSKENKKEINLFKVFTSKHKLYSLEKQIKRAKLLQTQLLLYYFIQKNMQQKMFISYLLYTGNLSEIINKKDKTLKQINNKMFCNYSQFLFEKKASLWNIYKKKQLKKTFFKYKAQKTSKVDKIIKKGYYKEFILARNLNINYNNLTITLLADSILKNKPIIYKYPKTLDIEQAISFYKL
jgi:ribosomal protein S4